MENGVHWQAGCDFRSGEALRVGGSNIHNCLCRPVLHRILLRARADLRIALPGTDFSECSVELMEDRKVLGGARELAQHVPQQMQNVLCCNSLQSNALHHRTLQSGLMQPLTRTAGHRLWPT